MPTLLRDSKTTTHSKLRVGCHWGKITNRLPAGQMLILEIRHYFSSNQRPSNLKWLVFHINLYIIFLCYHYNNSSQLNKLNTQYATDSYLVYILKMEYASKINIFGLKMMLKSGLEKFVYIKIPFMRKMFFYCDFAQNSSFLGSEIN